MLCSFLLSYYYRGSATTAVFLTTQAHTDWTYGIFSIPGVSNSLGPRPDLGHKEPLDQIQIWTLQQQESKQQHGVEAVNLHPKPPAPLVHHSSMPGNLVAGPAPTCPTPKFPSSSRSSSGWIQPIAICLIPLIYTFPWYIVFFPFQVLCSKLHWGSNHLLELMCNRELSHHVFVSCLLSSFWYEDVNSRVEDASPNPCFTPKNKLHIWSRVYTQTLKLISLHGDAWRLLLIWFLHKQRLWGKKRQIVEHLICLSIIHMCIYTHTHTHKYSCEDSFIDTLRNLSVELVNSSTHDQGMLQRLKHLQCRYKEQHN